MGQTQVFLRRGLARLSNSDGAGSELGKSQESRAGNRGGPTTPGEEAANRSSGKGHLYALSDGERGSEGGFAGQKGATTLSDLASGGPGNSLVGSANHATEGARLAGFFGQQQVPMGVGPGAVLIGQDAIHDPALEFDDGKAVAQYHFMADQLGGAPDRVGSVTVSVEFAKLDGAGGDVNPELSQFEIILSSPVKDIHLIAVDSFASDSVTEFKLGTVIFDDVAARAVNFDPRTISAGTFRPVEPLSGLAGTQVTGDWELRVIDTKLDVDPTAYATSTLRITTEAPAPMIP